MVTGVALRELRTGRLFYDWLMWLTVGLIYQTHEELQ